jgi:NAD(P)H-hydrate repair Nnr-like enzyme with NAD(P)H-hydrate dehydratase domain
VLLKGRDSIIASPGGPAVVSAAAYDRAAPWLATAGSGDVLAGMIAGLAARGIDLPDAVEMAAVLHVDAARRFGPGLIAEDLPECVPLVFRDRGV